MSMIFRTAAALGLSLEIAQNSLGHHGVASENGK